ncbi:MAG TPA: hypothetical protein ENL22_10090 [candidate division Zixibacteria bacterium]|nr:hypothetical protein [candidate division Zixibacteria bacterium]
MKKLTETKWKIGTIIIMTTLFGMSTTLSASDWWHKIKINGDFRYRHEIIDKENTDTRHRQRIRARVNITGKVSDETKIVLGISSGSDDPVSNNQTLTDAFSSKGLLIDLAYFEMNLTSVPGLKFVGGKAKNPFYKPGKSELIWDSDIRQEGISFDYSQKFDNFSIKLIGAGLWIQERGSSDDSYLAGGQALFTYNLSKKSGSITLGGAYFSYGNVKGFKTFYESDDSKGNSATEMTFNDETAYYYDTDFELIEAFGAFNFKAGHTPVTVMGDYITNTAADSLKNGWLAGVRLGKVEKPGTWEFRYIYRNLEKDATVGAFTDSDFRGGGTDAKGHEIGGSYQLMDNTAFAVTYFNNQIGLETSNKTDFHRWQIDLKFRF